MRHSPRTRLVPRGQMQRPSCVRIWPGSSLHCGGWSLRHSPRTRLRSARADAASVLRPDLARQQLALRRRRLAAFATDQVRSARADAASVLRPDLAGQQLALAHRGRRWRRWRRSAVDSAALPVAEGRAFRADAAAGVVHHEALRALLRHLCDGEGVAGEGLRAGRPVVAGAVDSMPSGPRPPACPAAATPTQFAPAPARRMLASGPPSGMTTVTWWTRDSPASSVRSATQEMRQRRRFRRAAEGRRDLGDLHAFQPRAAHADRVADADRAGEAGRAAIGDRDLERAGLADVALLVAGLLDVDRLRRCRLPHRPRRTDRRCRCREPDPTSRVRSSRSGHRSATRTVTSK